MSRHQSTAWWGESNKKPAFQRVSSLKIAILRPFVGMSERERTRTSNQWLKRLHPSFYFLQPRALSFPRVLWTLVKRSSWKELYPLSQRIRVQCIRFFTSPLDRWFELENMHML